MPGVVWQVPAACDAPRDATSLSPFQTLPGGKVRIAFHPARLIKSPFAMYIKNSLKRIRKMRQTPISMPSFMCVAIHFVDHVANHCIIDRIVVVRDHRNFIREVDVEVAYARNGM